MNNTAKTSRVPLTPRQYQLLSTYCSTHQIASHHKLRISVVLQSYDGHSISTISKTLQTTERTVSKWRTRWRAAYARLTSYAKECPRSDRELLQMMVSLLSDLPRPGASPRISDAAKASLLALACQKPSKYGLPVNQWTGELLAQVAQEQGLIESISVSYTNYLLRKKK